MSEQIPQWFPHKYDLWQHFKGGYYVILDTDMLLVDEPDPQRLIQYRSLATGQTFVRTAKNFLEHVDRDNYTGARFVDVRRKHGHVMFHGSAVDCERCANYQTCDDALAIFKHVESLPLRPGNERLTLIERVSRWFSEAEERDKLPAKSC